MFALVLAGIMRLAARQRLLRAPNKRKAGSAMTTDATLVKFAKLQSRDPHYPDAPPRDDMQKVLYLDNHSTIAALIKRFGDIDATFVGTRAHLGSSLNDPGDARVPDLIVAFNCDVARVWEDNGYCVANQPHAPQFVLEIASPGGGIVDFAEKRADYERYGVAEYWRFDPAAGACQDDSLAGERLVGGRYAPIAINRLEAERGRGHSEALGMFVCRERDVLRFSDPRAGGRYLRSLSEEAARADMEADARRRAEARADAEAEARRQAEARAAAAEARLAELERERRYGGG